METPIQAPVHAFPVAPLCLMTMPEASPVPCVVPSSWEIQVILATVLTSASALNYLHQLKTRRDISEHPAKGRADLRNHRRPECRPCGAGGAQGIEFKELPAQRCTHLLTTRPSNHESFKPREEGPGFVARVHTARTHMEPTACIYIGLFSKN